MRPVYLSHSGFFDAKNSLKSLFDRCQKSKKAKLGKIMHLTSFIFIKAAVSMAVKIVLEEFILQTSSYSVEYISFLTFFLVF